jgi:hypothetical protein
MSRARKARRELREREASNGGLDELMQFDWGLVGESEALAQELTEAAELDVVDAAAVDGRLRRIRELMGDRRRYLEIQA